MTRTTKQTNIVRFATAAVAMASLLSLNALAGSKAAPTKDIVDTAVAAGSFKTLAAALQAAGLIDTLKGPGPFTVFAPTDEAFAKLPAGTVEDLLKPENKDKARSRTDVSRRSGKCYGGSSCQNEFRKNGKRPDAHHSHEWQRRHDRQCQSRESGHTLHQRRHPRS